MTWHIHIEGQVQGVGFRPFVYLLAREYGLKGWVNNSPDGVHIEVNATEETARTFYRQLIDHPPALARITRHAISGTREKSFEAFRIVQSDAAGQASLLLTPDFALCSDCRTELQSSGNRRAGYPFITCTNCGPRFSIIQKLPYDRPHTSMAPFRMCPACREEYDDPEDRRYYSQTNSCPDCRIELSLYDQDRALIGTEPAAVYQRVVAAWRTGAIVAIKGIGGYLLTCDASNPVAVLKLRERKHRRRKPFALMFPGLASLEEVAVLKPAERTALRSPAAPILLLPLREGAAAKIALQEIAPGLNRVGAMLPYTPLFDDLLRAFGKAVVATSGNISNAPILFRDEEALSGFAEMAELILTNNREIVIPQDDSVERYTAFKGRRIILRRSRGLAPTFINPALHGSTEGMLATGADLKSAFAFLHQGNTYISQYLGELEHFDTQQQYQYILRHFMDLFAYKPQVILTDLHPSYASTQYGAELALSLNVPLFSFQHHLAHFAAVIGENELLHSREPVLGVIWDGTGLGDDGQIWGGEFFRYEEYRFSRCGHFDYFDFILGDKMPREPRISALAACRGLPEAEALLKPKFSNTEWQVYAHLLAKESPLQTSSVGRLFDAVASLLNIADHQTYEGEAALQLEALALAYFQSGASPGKMAGAIPALDSCYLLDRTSDGCIPTKTLMRCLLEDILNGVSPDLIAAKFHFSLVKIIEVVANDLNLKKIAFSGGVFQNGLLVDLLLDHLSNDFELFFHQQLSPNDENIAFGQLVYYRIKEQNPN